MTYDFRAKLKSALKYILSFIYAWWIYNQFLYYCTKNNEIH